MAYRFVFHTVGPRFNRRYRTAAESALFSCCRSTLTELRERGLRTLGMPAINTPTRNYLTKDAAPIILRTIRRFLEAHGDAIDRVVLCLSDTDRATYHTVLPMYFPRSDGEAAWSATVLPEDIGNAEGEPVIEERKIRIMSKPRMSGEGPSLYARTRLHAHSAHASTHVPAMFRPALPLFNPKSGRVGQAPSGPRTPLVFPRGCR